MCLGVPGKIIAVGEEIHELATVEVNGVQRQVNIALVCEDQPQDLLERWVLVHVGFAMSILDEDEARDMLSALENLTGEAYLH
ncbi:hydrogenase maturation factor HybG [Atlantibacter hermannii]|uniref:hydrogenase maturation factor HybG n=1 Tax=Atlantibacter hermannii TaxID=565 RepID=UPI00289BEDF9|nr:hydrogenase maturation factor HybG [Atlantibacter hermannii]MCQ4967685.1 hydrogenase maturation factor HybG [Enterobacteriaceae bacterium DFI.7.85]